MKERIPEGHVFRKLDEIGKVFIEEIKHYCENNSIWRNLYETTQ